MGLQGFVKKDSRRKKLCHTERGRISRSPGKLGGDGKGLKSLMESSKNHIDADI